MRKINKFIICLLLVPIAFISCKDEDKDPFTVAEDETNIAPWVRIKDFQSVVAAGDIASSSFDATVDVVRDNVASWDVTVSLESGGTTIDPVPLTSITSFPADISIPYTDIASLLGITTDDMNGGDFIRFLGTTTATDGRVYTFENYSASITGQPEQLQALNFIVLVKCSPISDATISGTWTLEMEDSFGDGWDGAFVTFEVDGVSTNYTISAGQGGAATHVIDVPAGTSELIISYTSGSFEEEHSYTVETPDGDIRGPFGAPGPDGPGPPPCIN
ncbi:hypothetical protein [Allomuricauda sp. SCSIO 65647]|uniref:hypothetical protein n=1 Tax=Allomuricauda sp. SCSIO 65647 TaxID=2908843 RepID=UPI001F3033C6|nr:hypothetical protein [Muricauda sp. SCSIO 65647]UJH66499.1 hypothetical protein L0P89_11045 [Muricauda sp. SCSIO 65647]